MSTETKTAAVTVTDDVIGSLTDTLERLGYSVDDDEDGDDFAADVERLARAGDRDGLASRLAGGGTLGAALRDADTIIAAVADTIITAVG